jgi:oligopeptide/dipeptide ABC transporter ATP-binding protein
MPKTILEVKQLSKHFRRERSLFSALNRRSNTIPAVDNVSFYLRENETMGLVGESGCGKTTVGRTILRLTQPTSGSVIFDGRDITHLSDRELRPLRKDMQLIFQDLDAGLNPKMRVQDILREAVSVYERLSDAEVEIKSRMLLDQVNLKYSKLSSYPAELSGGEKRRVGIARVLAVGAKLIVADEPTSALDVSIQAQVVNLLRDLQKQLGLSYLFISHDLQVVELMSDKVAVMYLGRIVEMGMTGRISGAARHPYTYILWSSQVERHSREAIQSSKLDRRIAWGVFDFERPASGCRFAPRCPVYQRRGRPAECTDPANEPQLRDVGEGHQVACHFPLGS